MVTLKRSFPRGMSVAVLGLSMLSVFAGSAMAQAGESSAQIQSDLVPTGRLAAISSTEAERVLARIEGWLETSRDGRGVSVSNAELVARFDAFRDFVEQSSSPEWAAAFDSHPRIGRVWARLYRKGLYKGCGAGAGSIKVPDMVAVAQRFPAPAQDDFVREIVTDGRMVQIDTRVADLVQPEFAAEMLRMLGKASGERLRDVPFTYGFVAGHRGMVEARPVLQRLADDVQTRRPTDDFATTARAELAAELRRYASMIEAQSPPTGLLDILRAPAGANTSDLWIRSWAMHRAVELKVDRVRIREAFLSYAQSLMTEAEKRPLPARLIGTIQHPLITTLAQFKQQALAAGVLRKDDLPDLVEQRSPF